MLPHSPAPPTSCTPPYGCTYLVQAPTLTASHATSHAASHAQSANTPRPSAAPQGTSQLKATHAKPSQVRGGGWPGQARPERAPPTFLEIDALRPTDRWTFEDTVGGAPADFSAPPVGHLYSIWDWVNRTPKSSRSTEDEAGAQPGGGIENPVFYLFRSKPTGTHTHSPGTGRGTGLSSFRHPRAPSRRRIFAWKRRARSTPALTMREPAAVSGGRRGPRYASRQQSAKWRPRTRAK
jgi:hypothetical protein